MKFPFLTVKVTHIEPFTEVDKCQELQWFGVVQTPECNKIARQILVLK